MYTLDNDQLVVTILDPVADQARLGSRYCSGGYIHQVTDHVHGPLVSGPYYPAEESPPVFHGQGLPEAFFAPRMLPQEEGGQEDTILVFGVGEVSASGLENQQFVDVDDIGYCAWEVTKTANMIRMVTMQSRGKCRVQLSREVSLHHRTIQSATRLTNMMGQEFSFRWFAHPFFPLMDTGECCKFSIPVTVSENPGYVLREDGFIVRKLDHAWDQAGHFLLQEFEPGEKLSVLLRHPKLGLVSAACDIPPAYMGIWGNFNTFGFEPFIERTLSRGRTTRWSMSYDF